MQDRSPVRAPASCDRQGAGRLRLTRAPRVESAGRCGHDAEREQQKVLPRVGRQLDGAQADEDREGEERGGERGGREREEHLCVYLFHPESLLSLDVADDSRRLDDYGFYKRRATASSTTTPPVCCVFVSDEGRLCRRALTTRGCAR